MALAVGFGTLQKWLGSFREDMDAVDAATGDLVLDALVGSPERMMARLKRACDDSCEGVSVNVEKVLACLRFAHESDTKAYTALAGELMKSLTAVGEQCKSLSTGMSAVTSLCESALLSDSVEVLREAIVEARRGSQLAMAIQCDGGAHRRWPIPQFTSAQHVGEQLVDVPSFDGGRFVCAFEKVARFVPNTLALHVRVGTAAQMTLVPADVTVTVDRGASIPWSCQKHADGCGVVVAFSQTSVAAMAVQLTATIRVFGVPVLQYRVVSWSCANCAAPNLTCANANSRRWQHTLTQGQAL